MLFASSQVTPLRSSGTAVCRLLADRSESPHAWSNASFSDDPDLVLLVLTETLELLLLDRARRARPSPLRRRENTCAPITVPDTPGGTRSDVSRHVSDAFSPKIARSSRSSGESWVSPFGVILPTRGCRPSLHLGADPDDAGLVEVRQGLFADVRDVPGDVLLAELGVASHALELLDVDRGEASPPSTDALGDENRVFEVVAGPGHEERRTHVLTAEMPARPYSVAGPSAITCPFRTRCRHPASIRSALVDAGVLVRARGT